MNYNEWTMVGEKARVKVTTEEYPLNPRDWDDLTTMVCFHRRYTLGDKHGLSADISSSWQFIHDYLVKEKETAVIYPLYLYDHSGISMKMGSPFTEAEAHHASWDSGQVGFIYIDKVAAEKLELDSDELHGICLDAVKHYSAYIEGAVYEWIYQEEKSSCSCGECTHWETIELGSGYIDMDEAYKDGMAAALTLSSK
jgi:hypothetical protein